MFIHGPCSRLNGQNQEQVAMHKPHHVFFLWTTSERGVSDSQNHNRPSGKIKKTQIINEIEFFPR